jgi:hypothetical protein
MIMNAGAAVFVAKERAAVQSIRRGLEHSMPGRPIRLEAVGP